VGLLPGERVEHNGPVPRSAYALVGASQLTSLT
jgi:hypothetical protein